jgi:hypothetical protein
VKPDNPPSDHALRVRGPYGQTLGLALILFFLLLGLGKGLVRTRIFRTHVVADQRGGRHEPFEHQLGQLETIVARDGPIDCIFLGNSMVWLGFDPEAFAKGYRDQTGQEIRCYNFGVAAMPAVAAGALAPILADEFHPRLLIYGTSAQDYALSRESEEATVLLHMPWLRYRQGHFSIPGWLSDRSRLFQYWRTLRHLLRLEHPYLLLTGVYASRWSGYGFESRDTLRASVALPPNPQSEDEADRYLYKLLSQYEMLPENLEGLHQVMALNGRDLQALIVEMPRPLTSVHFFGNGEQDQQRFINQVESMAESQSIPFWQTTKLGLIPEDGWWDYSHLNTQGARIFSEWLGQQVGSAVVQGRLQDPLAGP